MGFPFVKNDAFDPDSLCLMCKKPIRSLEIIEHIGNGYVHDNPVCGGAKTLIQQLEELKSYSLSLEGSIKKYGEQCDSWKEKAIRRKKHILELKEQLSFLQKANGLKPIQKTVKKVLSNE